MLWEHLSAVTKSRLIAPLAWQTISLVSLSDVIPRPVLCFNKPLLKKKKKVTKFLGSTMIVNIATIAFMGVFISHYRQRCTLKAADMQVTLHYPTLIAPLARSERPGELTVSKSLIQPLSLLLPLSLKLQGIRRGRAPAAGDGPTKQAIRMHSGATRTACNASVIAKAALRSTDCLTWQRPRCIQIQITGHLRPGGLLADPNNNLHTAKLTICLSHVSWLNKIETHSNQGVQGEAARADNDTQKTGRSRSVGGGRSRGV